MSVSQDFSRRFFADFIASRIRAWSLEEGEGRPTGRPVAGVIPDGGTRVDSGASDPASIDEPRGLIADLGSSAP